MPQNRDYDEFECVECFFDVAGFGGEWNWAEENCMGKGPDGWAGPFCLLVMGLSFWW